MYAVIETGGKQYRVSPGQTVEVELLPAEPGATVTLDRVLMVSADGRTLVGQPTVAGANVVGTVAREGRGPKVIIFRYKSKKRYRRKTGHRQDFTYLTITDIQAEGKSLVPAEQRRKFEESAARSAARFEARLATATGSAMAVGAPAPAEPAEPAAAAPASTKKPRRTASKAADVTAEQD
jgi:large subunit ribosomal protein L21